MFFFQNKQVNKHQLLVKRGVATKCFLRTCVLQNVKSHRFCLADFLSNLFDVQKHCKIGISAHMQKQKEENISNLGVIIWSK